MVRNQVEREVGEHPQMHHLSPYPTVEGEFIKLPDQRGAILVTEETDQSSDYGAAEQAETKVATYSPKTRRVFECQIELPLTEEGFFGC